MKAGHGGNFNIDAALNEINRSVNHIINPVSINVPNTALVDKSELPAWLIRILEKDNDVARAATQKKVELDSPHKTRLAQGIKRPKEFNDTKLAEHWLQVRLFYTLETQYKDIYPLVFSIPNGGYRTPKAASMMSYEGQKKGVPDIFFPIPRGVYHGFFLEVKTEKGRPSKEQQEKIKMFQDLGYYVVVAKGFDECICQINSYLQLPTFDNKTRLAA
ncbi:TPA: VRR-NUC domain-containing protein [Vibrio alginolyticus]